MRFHQLVFIFSFAAILLSSSFVNAQEPGRVNVEKEKPDWKFKDRIFVGGGVIFNLGGGSIRDQAGNSIPYSSFVIGASPIVGYKVTEKLSAGIGASYIYYRMKAQGDVYNTHIYGGNVFSRYIIYKDMIFAHAEYGFVNWEVPTYDINLQTYRNTRRNVPYLNLGGGLRQRIGNKSFFEIFVLYDVLHSQYSYNPYPLSYRAGVNVGF